MTEQRKWMWVVFQHCLQQCKVVGTLVTWLGSAKMLAWHQVVFYHANVATWRVGGGRWLSVTSAVWRREDVWRWHGWDEAMLWWGCDYWSSPFTIVGVCSVLRSKNRGLCWCLMGLLVFVSSNETMVGCARGGVAGEEIVCGEGCGAVVRGATPFYWQ